MNAAPDVTEFVYTADLFINNEYGETQLIRVTNSGTVAGNFTEETLEQAMIDVISQRLEVDPDSIDIARMLWSTYVADPQTEDA
jgi:hypothetical protein